MKELILNSVAVSVATKKYTEGEQSLIEAISKSSSVEVIIPDEITPKDFDVALSAVCKVLAKAHMQAEALMPVLGRLLFVASKNAEVYGNKFETFDAFLVSVGERFGVGRATCYEAKQFWTRWASVISTDDYKAVGRVKMGLLSKHIEKGKESQKKATSLIQFAKEHTVAELEEHMENQGLIEKGEATGAYFKFTCNKAQLKRFTKWFGDERVHAVNGTDDVAKIIDNMIAECSTEWLAKGEDMVKELAGKAQVLNAEEVIEEG